MSDDSNLPHVMTRRAAIARLVTLMGGALIGGEFILHGTRISGKETMADFSAADLALMDEIGETIIPATDTPGAKAAQVGAFMALIVRDGYDDRQHAIFRDGLKQIDDECRKRTGKSFLAASPTERTALLHTINASIPTANRTSGEKSAASSPHYLTMFKQLTIVGYFTSEIGCSQALRYNEVPGSYDGDVPYKAGDRAWFESVARPIRYE